MSSKNLNMKINSSLLLILSTAVMLSCNNQANNESSTTDSTSMSTNGMNAGTANGGSAAGGNYVDLKTGNKVTVDASGKYVDESGTPVSFYVNPDTRDTFSAETGTNVNNSLIYDNGDWRVRETTTTTTTETTAPENQSSSNNSDMKIKTEGNKTKVKTK
jgi:hypothetical protein